VFIDVRAREVALLEKNKDTCFLKSGQEFKDKFLLYLSSSLISPLVMALFGNFTLRFYYESFLQEYGGWNW